MIEKTKNILVARLRSNKKMSCALTGLLVVIFAALIGYAVGVSVQKERYFTFIKSFKTLRENSDRYQFINPLIGGSSAAATEVGIFSDLKADIEDYLNDEEKKSDLYAYSFYFRDLNSGLWFGSKEGEDFFPASLFKLPIAIAIYKQEESDPGFLKKRIVYTRELAERNILIQTNSQSVLTIGNAYTVEDLVSTMLTASDNGAKDALLSVMDVKYLEQLFSVVTLVDPKQTQSYKVSSRKYALFLRVLYGSSYLNEEHSELILSLLSESDFKDGLVAGIPANIKVAHKYGTYEFEEAINGVTTLTQQLHDCGVVYHLENPYLFCFMTKGKDEKTLFDIISHISKLVYDYQSTDKDN